MKRYTITQENFPAHEWIGLQAQIVSSLDIGLKGITGKIIDETKNTLAVETKKGVKIIPKKGSKLKFTISPKDQVTFDCSLMEERPEERTKIFYKKFHKKNWVN
ncbi:MAG: ribonuclease P protein subunit [Candidatus Diapherotrites archaeon]|nr:ribonuclease P protein subunit [Candidatus Diapherotrites archaeon]